MICGDDPTLPDLGGGCCVGADVYGPGRCTCWMPVHDLDQQPPDPNTVRLLAGGVQPDTRRQMCADCAYRPTSLEKTGDPTVTGSADALEDFAATGARFWCHQGMRRITALRHPAGAETPRGAAAYDPPIVDGIPYQADGQPGLLCAGWAARRRALTASEGAT